MADPDWEAALSWLIENNHTSTAANVAALQRYFRDYPQQAKMANGCGILPLHDAAWTQRGEHAVAIVTSLFNAYRDGVRHKDKYGSLPLHYAANHQQDEHGAAIVTLLLTVYPNGAMEKNNGGYLPADYAEKKGTLPNACIAMLRAAVEREWEPPSPAATQGTVFVYVLCYLLHLLLNLSRISSLNYCSLDLSLLSTYLFTS